MKDQKIFLVENGKSEYKIVIPDNADFYENYAADELKRLFFDATGVKLDILKESQLPNKTLDQTQAIFSLGNTAICKNSAVNYSFELLKRDGYRIVTKGKTVIMVGGGGYGTVYAVYGFLERQFGYRYYNPDEVFIRKTQTEQLINFDVTDVPDFENRTGGFYYSGSDYADPYEGIPDCAIRMRTLEFFGTCRNGEDFFGCWDHNHHKFIPGQLYYEDHPDWWSPYKTQLCLSNEEMWKEFTKRLIKYIEKKKDGEYFLLGQEDIPTFCWCDRCRKLEKKIGKSGIMMRFVNHVAREVKKWQAENCPERKIYIGTFAYQLTEYPPIKKDRKGNYKPLKPCVVPEDNVFILLALIEGDFSVTINNEEHNIKQKEILDGWASLTDNIMLWYYCSNFHRSFGFFDNFHVLSENYKIFKKYNFKWLYYENNYGKQGMAFQSMLLFVHSQLAWNVNLDLPTLVNEFMEHFYKQAAPQMKEYLKKMHEYHRNKKAELSKELGKYVGTYIWSNQEFKNTLSKDFYSYEFLQEMAKLLESAIKAIKKAGYDSEMEKKLIDRIKLERLTIQYLVGQFFRSEFSEKDYVKYLDNFEKDCEMLGIKGKIELSWTASDTVQAWKEGRKCSLIDVDLF